MNNIMNKNYTIKDHILNGKYIRVRCYEEYDYTDNNTIVLSNIIYKLEIKIKFLFIEKFIILKQWNPNIEDEEDIEFAKRESIECFNNLVNPYNVYG